MTSSIPAALSDIVEQARDVRERCLDCALAAIPERDDAEGWLSSLHASSSARTCSTSRPASATWRAPVNGSSND